MTDKKVRITERTALYIDVLKLEPGELGRRVREALEAKVDAAATAVWGMDEEQAGPRCECRGVFHRPGCPEGCET